MINNKLLPYAEKLIGIKDSNTAYEKLKDIKVSPDVADLFWSTYGDASGLVLTPKQALSKFLLDVNEHYKKGELHGA